MGIFKSVGKIFKKAIAFPFKVAGALLGIKKPPDLDTADVPESPLAGAEPTHDAALREQETGQRAAGGGVSSAESASDLLLEDEVKKRQASRMILG